MKWSLHFTEVISTNVGAGIGTNMIGVLSELTYITFIPGIEDHKAGVQFKKACRKLTWVTMFINPYAGKFSI